MKVVQTTEFEVLGPLTPENVKDIQSTLRDQTSFVGTLSTFLVSSGFYILIGSDHTWREVHPADYAAQYESVEGNTLDRMEEEFSLASIAQQGELHTEEVWQCWEAFSSDVASSPPQWWDATNEQNARQRTTNGQVRMRRDITVNGPWKYFEVKQ